MMLLDLEMSKAVLGVLFFAFVTYMTSSYVFTGAAIATLVLGLSAFLLTRILWVLLGEQDLVSTLLYVARLLLFLAAVVLLLFYVRTPAFETMINEFKMLGTGKAILSHLFGILKALFYVLICFGLLRLWGMGTRNPQLQYREVFVKAKRILDYVLIIVAVAICVRLLTARRTDFGDVMEIIKPYWSLIMASVALSISVYPDNSSEGKGKKSDAQTQK